MAREKKLKPTGEATPAWLITFTDMMTLMLTFFVLLVSMSVMDERRRLVVLGSIIGTFGMGELGYDMRTIKNKRTTVEPGPMDLKSVNDMEPLKSLLWEDINMDLNFQSNKFVQVLSISEEVLFTPGGTELTPKGKRLLNRMAPVLISIDHPLLLAGHTSNLREELGENYKVRDKEEVPDATWRLSLFRVLAVYRYFLDLGMDPELLRMEGFGRFRPRYGDQTPAERRKNRSVDIVLDKRNSTWIATLEKWKAKEKKEDGTFVYRDFVFDVREGEEKPGLEGQ